MVIHSELDFQTSKDNSGNRTHDALQLLFISHLLQSLCHGNAYASMLCHKAQNLFDTKS